MKPWRRTLNNEDLCFVDDFVWNYAGVYWGSTLEILWGLLRVYWESTPGLYSVGSTILGQRILDLGEHIPIL